MEVCLPKLWKLWKEVRTEQSPEQVLQKSLRLQNGGSGVAHQERKLSRNPEPARYILPNHPGSYFSSGNCSPSFPLDLSTCDCISQQDWNQQGYIPRKGHQHQNRFSSPIRDSIRRAIWGMVDRSPYVNGKANLSTNLEGTGYWLRFPRFHKN